MKPAEDQEQTENPSEHPRRLPQVGAAQIGVEVRKTASAFAHQDEEPDSPPRPEGHQESGLEVMEFGRHAHQYSSGDRSGWV
jgi:hypothetical protein